MRRLLLIGGAAAALLLATALPAAAKGGWATTTLDEAPRARAGDTTEIGFTILQHGVTPVDVDDVAVIIDDRTFPAVQDGEVGHYTAEVTFPDEGKYEWTVRQGWFGDYDMGTLRVGGDDAGTAGTGSWWDRTSWPMKTLLAVPLLMAAGLYVLDRSRNRSRSRPPAATTTPIG
jgi:hypothetical protein